MSTAFSKLLSAVIATLAAQPAVCKRIYRDRTEEFPAQDEEAINVELGDFDAQRATIRGAPTDWETHVIIDCFARSATETGSVAVDPLVDRVGYRLSADPTLGGMVDDFFVLGGRPGNATEAKKTGWVRLTFVAVHRTTDSIFS